MDTTYLPAWSTAMLVVSAIYTMRQFSLNKKNDIEHLCIRNAILVAADEAIQAVLTRDTNAIPLKYQVFSKKRTEAYISCPELITLLDKIDACFSHIQTAEHECASLPLHSLESHAARNRYLRVCKRLCSNKKKLRALLPGKPQHLKNHS